MGILKAEGPMKDVPHTAREEQRQRGPTPLIAYFLAAGLVLALVAFYFPVLFATIERAINK